MFAFNIGILTAIGETTAFSMTLCAGLLCRLWLGLPLLCIMLVQKTLVKRTPTGPSFGVHNSDSLQYWGAIKMTQSILYHCSIILFEIK